MIGLLVVGLLLSLQAGATETAQVGERVSIELQDGPDSRVYVEMPLDQQIFSNDFILVEGSLQGTSRWDPIKVAIFGDSDKPLVECYGLGVIACPIASNRVGSLKQIGIMYYCEDDCVLTFQSSWNNVTTFGTPESMSATIEPTKRVHSFSIRVKSILSARLELRPELAPDNQDQITMVANSGRQLPSPNNYEFKSVPSVTFGQILLLDAPKSDYITVLIFGRIKNPYRLTLEHLMSDTPQLELNKLREDYLKPNQKAKYQIGSLETTVFLKVITYTGSVSASIFKDELFSQLYSLESIEYLNTQVDKIEPRMGIMFVQVTAVDSATAYTVQLTPYSPKTSTIAHLHAPNIIELGSQPHIVTIPVPISVQQGSVELSVDFASGGRPYQAEFRLCLFDIRQCTDKIRDYTSQVISTSVSKLGSKDFYKFQLNLKETAPDIFGQGSVNVIVVLTQSASATSFLAILSYRVGSQLTFLRERTPIEDCIEPKEVKYYCYTLHGWSQLEQIRIHVTPLAGQIKYYGTRKDARVASTETQVIKPVVNTLIFQAEAAVHRLFVVVSADVHSSFSITVQSISSERAANSVNEIVLSQDIPYQLNLLPEKSQHLLLTTLTPSLVVDYQSGQPIFICLLSTDYACIEQPVRPQKKGQFPLEHGYRTQYLKISNPSASRTAQLLLRYHSLGDKHCEVMAQGRIEAPLLKNSSCLSYSLSENGDDELIVIFNRQSLTRTKLEIKICGELLQEDDQRTSFIIDSKHIIKACATKHSIEVQLKTVFIGEGDQIHAEVGVYWSNRRVELTDGVRLSQKGNAKLVTAALHHYAYWPKTLFEGAVVWLRVRSGQLKLYGRITEDINQNQTVSKFNSTFTAEEIRPGEQALLIKSTQWRKVPCVVCVLLLSVQCDQLAASTDFNYEIVVHHDHRLLHHHQLTTGILSADQVAPFAFQPLKCSPNQDIEVFLRYVYGGSPCAEIFMDSDPSPEAQSKGDLHSVKKPCKSPLYYISVKAKTDCLFGVEVTEGKSQLSKLELGQARDFQLLEDSLHFFYFQNENAANFKIATIIDYGKVLLYGNRTQFSEIDSLMASDSNLLNSFTHQSAHDQTLRFKSTEPGFCTRCNYAIVVRALTKVKGSLVATGSAVSTQIQPNRHIFTELQPFEKASFLLSQVMSGQLTVYVVKGAVQLSVEYLGNLREPMKFEAGKGAKTVEIEVEVDKPNGLFGLLGFLARGLVNFKFTNIGEDGSVFSFSFKRQVEISSLMTHILLTLGQPFEMQLVRGQRDCVSGFFDDGKLKIFLSVAPQLGRILQDLQIELSVDGKVIHYPHRLMKNNIEIWLEKGQKAKERWKLCVQWPHNPEEEASATFDEPYQTVLPIMILQNSLVDLMISGYEYPVTGQGRFLLHGNTNQLMLEVIECEGEATVAQADNYRDLFMDSHQKQKTEESSEDNSSNIFGDPFGSLNVKTKGANPNDDRLRLLIRQDERSLYYERTTPEPSFYRVRAARAIVRYLDVDDEKGMGNGNQIYRPGGTNWRIVEDGLQVEWTPLKRVADDTLLNVTSATAYIYVAHSDKVLKRVARCETQDSFLLEYDMDIPFDQFHDSNHSFTINRTHLAQMFPTSPTIYVGINLVIQLAQRKTAQYNPQTYQFLYPVLAIRGEDAKAQYSSGISSLIILFVCLTVGLLALIVFILVRGLRARGEKAQSMTHITEQIQDIPLPSEISERAQTLTSTEFSGQP